MKRAYPLENLIPEIVSRDNIIDCIDYVIDHMESRHQRERYRPDRSRDESEPGVKEGWDRYVNWRERTYELIAHEIETGEFTITRGDVQDIHVKDGPKERDVQCPVVVKRCGIGSVMAVVEKYINPLLIKNTAASIKGRGMHWLHHILEDDLRNAPELSLYYGQTDIVGYYDNIPQEGMKACIRTVIADPILLRILDSFIELMPRGLSKGLRSSQCLANLYLNPVHQRMLREVRSYVLTDKDGNEERRYLYYSYCDDTDFLTPDKKEAWRLMGIYREEVAKLGLTVKPTYAVRPVSEGLDCLGFVHYRDPESGKVYSLLRKRIKQKAARKLAKVKSRKRRQEIAGSFKGMACHADCKHLYQKLTGKQMAKFSELGLKYTPKDGKKRFDCQTIPLGSLTNRQIVLLDYEQGIETHWGVSRYVVLFRFLGEGTEYKFFTNSEELKSLLDQMKGRDLLPGEVETTIVQKQGTGALRIYTFG